MWKCNIHLASICLILSLCYQLIVGKSYTWGQLHKYSSMIYDDEITVNDLIEFSYPLAHDENSYIITAMHAFDPFEVNDEFVGPLQASIQYGGIGYNFTKMQFSCSSQLNKTKNCNIRFTIYGVDE